MLVAPGFIKSNARDTAQVGLYQSLHGQRAFLFSASSRRRSSTAQLSPVRCVHRAMMHMLCVKTKFCSTAWVMKHLCQLHSLLHGIRYHKAPCKCVLLLPQICKDMKSKAIVLTSHALLVLLLSCSLQTSAMQYSSKSLWSDWLSVLERVMAKLLVNAVPADYYAEQLVALALKDHMPRLVRLWKDIMICDVWCSRCTCTYTNAAHIDSATLRQYVSACMITMLDAELHLDVELPLQ